MGGVHETAALRVALGASHGDPMPPSEQTSVGIAVRRIVSNAQELVRLFLEEPDRFGSGFAGPTFDTLAPNPPDEWCPSDLVAVGLLDVTVPPAGVRRLLVSDAHEFNEKLAAIDRDVTLWSEDETRVTAALGAVRDATRLLESIKGVRTTRSSKLLARKRPHLCPINDSVVRRELGIGRNADLPLLLRHALIDGETMRLIRLLRPTAPGFEGLSPLRLLDIAVWMSGSNSRAAKQARQAALQPGSPSPA